MKRIKFLVILLFPITCIIQSCKDDMQNLPTLSKSKRQSISLTKGGLTLNIEGTPQEITISKTKELIDGSGKDDPNPRKIYNLDNFKLPGESVPTTDPNYSNNLGDAQQKYAHLYVSTKDKKYSSGIITCLATYTPADKKIKIKGSFDLKDQQGNKPTNLDNLEIVITGLLGGKVVPNSTKIFIDAPSNSIFHDRIIAQSPSGEDLYKNEFIPPIELKAHNTVIKNNSVSMKDLKFNLYGAIIGFKIKNNFSDLISTSSFKIKTNAFSVSGNLDLSKYDDNGDLIHLASDPDSNKDAKGIIARNTKDLELVTSSLLPTSSELKNYVYRQYKMSRSIGLKSGQQLDKDFFVYTWVMPNGYEKSTNGSLDKSNIQNVCNELYASINLERSIDNEEGSAPYVSLNSKQLKERKDKNINTYTDPIIKPCKSYLLSINAGEADNGVPSLMFKRVLLGNMVSIDQTTGNSRIRVSDGRNLYRHPNFQYVQNKQINMIEVYNPTNQDCDMTKYFLMGYSAYDKDKKKFQYVTIHGAKSDDQLEKIYNALMAPLSPRNNGGRIATLDKYNNDLGPAFIEANISYFSKELSGNNNPQELQKIDNPDFHRYAAITFFEGKKTFSKAENESRLNELKTLKGKHSVVYMGPMSWYWTTFQDTDNPQHYKYFNYECYYEKEYYDPMGEYKPKDGWEHSPIPFAGANWDKGYEANKATTTYVAINDAFCNKSEQIIDNAWKMASEGGNHWESTTDPSKKDLCQIRMGWPSMGSNAATLYEDSGSGNLDFFIPSNYFDRQYTGYNDNTRPRWIPGVFGVSAAQGLLLVKMTQRAVYEKNSTTPKIEWVPEIVDVTPLAKDSDNPNESQILKNYYGYTGFGGNAQYFGGYEQPRTYGRDFKKYYYSVYMIKYAPKFYPSPDVLNEGRTWIFTKNRREPDWGGNFGEKSFPDHRP